MNRIVVWRSLTRHGMLAALIVVGGCAGGGQPKPQAKSSESWSSKEESTLAVMPERPEVNLGPAFAVVADPEDLRAAATDVLLKAADSTNPLLRMNAIEGLQYAPDAAPAAVRKGLGDGNRAVRFVSAMLVGQLKMMEMRTLVEPLLHDESQSVQAAAMYAVSRCGGKPDLSPLSSMLLGEDPEVKANAALVLGELGDPSAVSLLRYALGRGLLKSSTARRKIVELQIAEAMVKLGDMQELEIIRASLFSRAEDGEITALACQICGEVKDEGSLPNLIDLATRTGRLQQSAEIRMAAALAVGQINPQQAILAVPEAYVSSERFELRAQAAATIGGSGQKAAMPALQRLLADPNPMVQVCAAAGILQLGP